MLGFYKEGFALDEPYLSLIEALDAECQSKGGIGSKEDWLAIVSKVLKDQEIVDANQESNS